MSPVESLLAALKRANVSQTELARRIGKRQGHVWAWINRDKSFPAEVCGAIVLALDGQISLHELRPDLWGPGATPVEPSVAEAAEQ